MMSSAHKIESPWLGKALNLVTQVQPGEAVTALLLTLNLFLLLAAYYIIRPVRDTLILIDGGAEIKSYLGAVLAALFLVLVPAYGALASKVNRIRLINSVSLFFISNLIAFFAVGKAGIRLGIPFFVWVGIFNLMTIAQFWSFSNDVYTPEQGKRLFPMVGIGSSVGAVAGSYVGGLLLSRLGLLPLMLVSAALLGLCLLLTNIIHVREKSRAGPSAQRSQADQPLDREGGFQLVLRNRYLLFIGLVVLMVNWVNTNGEYILAKTLSMQARELAAAAGGGSDLESQVIARFYANYQFGYNLLGAVFQFFLVSRILKHWGVRRALFILPVISLSGYSLLAVAPILPYIKAAKILENSTDYSLQNTVRHALFLPTQSRSQIQSEASHRHLHVARRGHAFRHFSLCWNPTPGVGAGLAGGLHRGLGASP
jgi:AAA family ATP:ADP antiporter